MLNILNKLFGQRPTTNFKELMEKGALILDVRSKSEYASGHIKGSINIPVDALQKNLHLLKDKSKTIITCCASGMRSASAKSFLESSGYSNVINGGGRSSLQHKI